MLLHMRELLELLVSSDHGPHVASKILTTHTAWIKGLKEIVGLMLMAMEPEIQRNLKNLHAHEMILELKTLFAQQAEQELLQTTLGKTINELHAMLKLHQQTLPKNNAPALHAIRSGIVQKVNKYKKPQPQMPARGQSHGKGKNKLVYAPKPNISPPPKREDLAKGLYLKRTQLRELVVQGLKASRKLKQGVLSLYIGNGQREAVEVIGVFNLCLPNGFINRFVNNTIQVSRNNMVYFSAIPRDGIFEIDFSNSYTNESSIYAVSNKRYKLDLDSTLSWHCLLVHISKKRIQKLKHDGLLNSTDLRAFEKCVPYMSGMMARKPYTHQVKRAKDLLGLIQTNVCNPFKIISRQGASYFITFTDDFSGYGYVYLLKHKHKVFETFKVFQKEVETQLGKTIKSPRSDRGGEYMSQEFLDHLKDQGIIAHRTPPYTPQHNRVSERKIRTLLDMLKLSKSQGASTPAELKCMQNVPYALAVGSIMYVVRCTRPDVAFAQNVTSQFQQNPGDLYWTTVKNILKYLRNTKDMFLVYEEAEYIAAFDASKEAAWVRKFISRLGVVPTI
nr:hypothetical protein [Tanacetum cinerariifolium]